MQRERQQHRHYLLVRWNVQRRGIQGTALDIQLLRHYLSVLQTTVQLVCEVRTGSSDRRRLDGPMKIAVDGTSSGHRPRAVGSNECRLYTHVDAGSVSAHCVEGIRARRHLATDTCTTATTDSTYCTK